MKRLSIEELKEPNGITILLEVTKEDLKTLNKGNIPIYSDKLSVNGIPLTIKLVPNPIESVQKDGDKHE